MNRETSRDKVIDAALKLPRQQRALLAEKLLESLDYDDRFDVSPEWISEIQMRCREIDEGRADLIPADDVFREIDNQLG